MTIREGKGINDMLNLPPMDEVIEVTKHPVVEDDNEDEQLQVDVDLLRAAEKKLAHIDGSDHAKAMDDIHRETLDHSRNLMDLAYNVDDRARRGILEIATAMYKNAMDAKNSKRDMQLRVMKLMQDQQKIDMEAKRNGGDDGVVEGKATIVEDRNELIKQIRAAAKLETPPENK